MTADTSRAFLNGPGDMAALMRAKDWAATPFGPVETWSPALRSAIGICLGSRFPIVLYWGPTRALIYNDAWSPVPGNKHPWALGRPGREVWAEIWDIIGPMFDHVMTAGEATWSEDQLLPLNRFGYVEECYFYYSYSPVRGEDGRVEGIFTAVTETTQRVLAERRERLLRGVSEATSRARSAAEACKAAVGCLVTLPEESPFALAYLRDASSGALQRVASEGLPPGGDLAPERTLPDCNPTPWPFAEALATGAPVTVEGLTLRCPGRLPGTPWPEAVEQALVVPILSARADAPHGFLVTGISPRRRIDAPYVTLFERAAGHIATAITNAEAYEEERRRAEMLAELDRAKTAFFSNASHEFRTPLTLMLGPVEDMLQRSPAEDRAAVPVERDALELVHRNGQRLLRLVNALLDVSRIEAGRMKARFEPVDLAAFTAELASSFRSAMDRAGLDYRIDCPPLPEPVWIDRDLWEKIVLNLISNAFKYTLSGGVAVAVQPVGERAVLTVRDTGVGIPAEEQPRVFDRFHRIEGQSGRTHEGTGIGLALVKDLTQLHGGTVALDSDVGRGSTFTVTLPFGNAHVPATERPAGPIPASTATRADAFVAEALHWLPQEQGEQSAPALVDGASSGPAPERMRNATILLADDNADMRSYVERLLTAAGYRVETVGDGVAAVETAKAAPPDLVLSDVMMPHLDGFGVIAALRGHPHTRDLPIILLSARAGEESSIEGLQAGADDYLVKPFSARELLARVEGALRLAELRRETAEQLRQANEALERRVEERTRERDRFWRLSRDPFLVADREGRWLSASPAWTEILGWTEAEMLGRTSEWMEHPDDCDKTRREVRKLAGGGSTFRFENRFRTRGGHYRDFAWTATPADELMFCVARDVTEEKERAATLRKTEEQLRQSQKMEAVGQLTGGMAHDFNNLLQAMSSCLQLVSRRVGHAPEVEPILDAGRQAVDRGASLIRQLMAFSRRQSLQPEAFDVRDRLLGLRLFLDRALRADIGLEFALQGGLWPVMADPVQFDLAVLNLATNARDAIDADGAVVVGADNVVLDGMDGLSGEFLKVFVRDSGRGIAPDALGRVFEPFFTTKAVGKGTGLGLAQVYGFCRQSGGTATVESVEGKGTVVSLLLPRAEATVASETPNAPPVLPSAADIHVLLVEDDPVVAPVVTAALEDLGYRVTRAATGEEALRRLEEAAVDLLFSDVVMPGSINGVALAQEARQRWPDLGILLTTGYSEDLAATKSVRVLSKPYRIEDLAHAIQEELEDGARRRG
ncbi:response regulator [Azospirillum sp. 11R-A]|uniref:response regulator n=1 Tax=Azospirillum sp. 11R-A TaxID=3111634 RepID=UPI003C16E092